MNSVYFRKRLSKAIPPFVIRHSLFVIRHSAVLCLIQTIEAACLIIKIPGSFGVVSHDYVQLPTYNQLSFNRLNLNGNSCIPGSLHRFTSFADVVSPVEFVNLV